MGDERNDRVNDALLTLVGGFLRRRPEADEATAEDRRNRAVDLARDIIKG